MPSFEAAPAYPRNFAPALSQSGFNDLLLLILQYARSLCWRSRLGWILNREPRFVNLQRTYKADVQHEPLSVVRLYHALGGLELIHGDPNQDPTLYPEINYDQIQIKKWCSKYSEEPLSIGIRPWLSSILARTTSSTTQ